MNRVGRPKSRMTPQWEKVLRFIKAYMVLHGVSPSYEVIAKSLGMKAKSNAHRMVGRLMEEGYLEMSRKHRGVKVVDRSVREVSAL